MKIAITGASGRLGHHVVKLALKDSHEVVAMVRNPDAYSEAKKDLIAEDGNIVEIAAVNLYDADSMVAHLNEVDAILVCHGPVGSKNLWKCTIFTETMPEIVKAAEAAGVKRIVYASTWCSEARPGNPFLTEWVIKPLLLGAVFRDHRNAEVYLEEKADSIEYTTVRAPILEDAESEGKEIMFAEGLMWLPGSLKKIPRGDVAKYMLKCVTQQLHANRDVAIGLKGF